MADKPGFRITTLLAFTAIDENDEEGVCAQLTPSGWMPLIGADEARVAALRPIAEELERETGRPVTLKRFVLVAGTVT